MQEKISQPFFIEVSARWHSSTKGTKKSNHIQMCGPNGCAANKPVPRSSIHELYYSIVNFFVNIFQKKQSSIDIKHAPESSSETLNMIVDNRKKNEIRLKRFFSFIYVTVIRCVNKTIN